MKDETRAIASKTITETFIARRSEGDHLYLLKSDLESNRIMTSNPVDFIVAVNGESKKIGLQIPVIAKVDAGSIVKEYVSSDDIGKLWRYHVKEVMEIGDVTPERISHGGMTCPACKKQVYPDEPIYFPPPCRSGCNLPPARWIVDDDTSTLIDVARGMVLLEGPIGKQEVHFSIDRELIVANGNYQKLASWTPPGTLFIDAIPVVEYHGGQSFSIVLWICNVEAAPRQETIQERGGAIPFIVDVAVNNEKNTVHAVFFRNLDYMRELLHFDRYALQTAFPDLIIRDRNGNVKIIEFEFESKNFDEHGHEPSVVDYIICWIDNRKKKDHVRVIAMNHLAGTSVVPSGT